MGALLREALRTICVNNQWSYAVFWKIGCQNANLLIWEECFYEPQPSSLPPRISGINSSQLDSRAHENVHLLIDRMMLNNRIILVGEGMVGRAVITGNNQWVLPKICHRDAHPPEVTNELLLQLSAGIQTVAVIPVLPHGVVQLGSHLPMMENLGFVNEVKSLILQLGCVPGALFSDYAAQDSADLIGVPVSEIHKTFRPGASVSDAVKQIFSSSVPQKFPSQVLADTIGDQIKRGDSENRFGEWQRKSFLGAEVIPSDINALWTNQNFSSFNSGGSQSSLEIVEQQILSNAGFQEDGTDGNIANIGNASGCEDMHNQSSSPNDLLDIFGLDPKSKAVNGSWSTSQVNNFGAKTENLSKEFLELMNIQEMGSDIYSGYEYSGADNLLDAVVSRACSTSKQVSDDADSCKTGLTKISNSSVDNNRFSSGFRGELCEIPNAETSRSARSSFFGSGFSKDNTWTCSQTTSAQGSQISSWVEQAHNMKPETSVSTGYSKMKNEIPKPNRKRLKPGENPRPRPKDRQMIQDRVKELREIIPNAAKCSIDALLERTIKHMLFLQSVTKHADKLKQTGESKIINKEGGATWAFEVGSQSMVCPIVVEDLNPPRNFLVEMLCEERGFFLEIADWIRGLGLTILKGVMEARNDKIWARFAVEANRDVTRMEIFMSLVNLLKQTMKTVGPAHNILDGINGTMAMNPFPQAATIPATGRGSSLS